MLCFGSVQFVRRRRYATPGNVMQCRAFPFCRSDAVHAMPLRCNLFPSNTMPCHATQSKAPKSKHRIEIPHAINPNQQSSSQSSSISPVAPTPHSSHSPLHYSHYPHSPPSHSMPSSARSLQLSRPLPPADAPDSYWCSPTPLGQHDKSAPGAYSSITDERAPRRS
jgi:hypothetical protein